MLTNLMEEKQLNFDQPLLSVRRHAPIATSQRSERRKMGNSKHAISPLPCYRSELKSGPIANPGAVPFQWEHSPGQPKEETKPQKRSDRPPIAPKLPPGRHPKPDPQDCPNVSPNPIGCKNQAVDLPRTRDNDRQVVDAPCDEKVRNLEGENASSGSEDSDGEYVDALDTLSRAESSFLNCSMSGLSGLDYLDAKPSRNFSTDVQVREFMMDRFLPAAKAMASETPQYAPPKKQPVLQQQPQQVTKQVNQLKPSLRYGPSFAARYSHYHESEEEEESDDEYDQRKNMPVCGLLPRFCLKSSLCILNPIPAMSVRTRVPKSSGKKGQPRSSSSGSYNETENENRSDQAELKSVNKIQVAELDKESTKLRNESDQLESLSTSTYGDPSLPFLEEKEVLSFPVEKRGFEMNSGDPVIEKTLYVDTVHKVESPNLRLPSPTKQDTEGEDHEIITDRIDQMHVVDSSVEDFKELVTINGDDKSTEKRGTEVQQGFGENLDFSLISTEMTIDEQELMDGSEKQLLQVVTLEKSRLPAPPPLPKSPSDSWLWRTLPSMPTKGSPLRSYYCAAMNPEKGCKKAPNGDMKWETIVTTTKVQRRHLHSSEGLLSTIPET